MMNKTSYVTSVTMQFSKSLVTCLTCGKTMKKMCTFKSDMNKYFSLQKADARNAKITEKKFLHMQELPLTTPTKIYMCVSTQICINMYVKCSTK